MAEAIHAQPLPRITPDDLPGLALDMARSGLALMLYGTPGIGKTALFQGLGQNPELIAMAEARSGFALEALPVVTLSAPELNVEDLMGVPTVENLVRRKADGTELTHKVTRWALPAQLDPHRPFILFIDEPNRCDSGVRNALFQLITSRTTSGGFALPPGSLVCMAGNRLEDRAGVRALDTAFNNRCGHFELVVEPEAWLAWASTQAGFSSLVRAFIAAHPNYLHRFDPGSPVPQQPTPRTWAALAYALGDGSLRGTTLAHGLVGAEASRLFAAFAEHAAIVPSIQDLVEHPENITLPSRGELDAAWILATSLADHLVSPTQGSQDQLGSAVGQVLGRLAERGFEEVAVFSLRRAWRRIEKESGTSGLPFDRRLFQAIPALAARPSFQELLDAMDQVGNH
jgi:hypothetical protein